MVILKLQKESPSTLGESWGFSNFIIIIYVMLFESRIFNLPCLKSSQFSRTEDHLSLSASLDVLDKN